MKTYKYFIICGISLILEIIGMILSNYKIFYSGFGLMIGLAITEYINSCERVKQLEQMKGGYNKNDR